MGFLQLRIFCEILVNSRSDIERSAEALMGFKNPTLKHLPYKTCHTTFALNYIKHKYDCQCFSSQIKLGSGGR